MNLNPLLLPEVSEYLRDHCVRSHSVAEALFQYTQQHVAYAQWLTTPEQVQFLAMMIETLAAKRIIEVGVYTGHATLVMADAMGPQGHLIACDKSQQWLVNGQPFWQQAGVADRIELRIAPAVETLQTLIDEGQAGSIDMMFIDADKINYSQYYEQAMVLLRPGGVMIFDNALWIGEHTYQQSSPAARSLHQLNRRVTQDQRVISSCLACGSGLLMACKRR